MVLRAVEECVQGLENTHLLQLMARVGALPPPLWLPETVVLVRELCKYKPPQVRSPAGSRA